jgi:mitogen-activated protein kinase 1/3
MEKELFDRVNENLEKKAQLRELLAKTRDVRKSLRR